MLHKSAYPKIERYVNEAAAWLQAKGISPNQLTVAGCALSFLTGIIYASGNFFFAGLLLIAASIPDMLDGALARASNQTSKFGAFLDSTLDRYSDFFLFSGLSLYFAKQAQGGWALISLGVLLGAFATSYAKARAENFIPDCRVGLFERPERIVALALGSLLPFLMPLALWVLLIGTNLTAIYRIIHTHRALSDKP